MSLQTLIGLSTSTLSLTEMLTAIHDGLSNCESVKGLYSVQRLSGESYIQLQRNSILSAPEGTHIDFAELETVAGEIQRCDQGLEARWEVERFRRNGSDIEPWSHYLSFLFEPATHRSYVLSGIEDVYFIDGGSQQHYLPSRMEDDVAAEAAGLNLELLVDEMEAIAAIPVKRLSGLPVHIIDPECPVQLNSLWLYFDGSLHQQQDGNLVIRGTRAGPIYYSPRGPLGDLQSLQLLRTL